MKLINLAKKFAKSGRSEFTEQERSLFEPLTNLASLALRAGVSLSLDEFSELEDIERVAFARAGDEIRKEDSVRAGLSAQGVEGLAHALEDEELYEALEHQKVVDGSRR